MAWLDAFQALKQNERSFESVLLRGGVPLVANGESLSPSAIERASAVLAAHLPNHASTSAKTRLMFLLPNATQSLGRFLAVSLLLADFVRRKGGQGAILRGDLLLVTQHIKNCVNLLRSVSLRHRSEQLHITEFWPIEVLSQYAPSKDSNPRVFVANPGWSSVFGQRQTFGSVVIDASHPRTADHLEDILKQPSVAAAPFQILVIPPWEQDRINALAEPGRPSDLIWAWDPAAVEAIEELLGGKKLPPPKSAGRFLWLSNDPEVEDQLVELHLLLVGAMKAGRGSVPGGVLGAWGTYHKLRQLAVPLVDLEEERRGAYQTLTLQDRIQELEDDPPEARGAAGPYLDARWPSIISRLKALYDVLLRRQMPAKFYTLASVVNEFLQNKSARDTLRIVAPSAHEGNMLASLLGEILNEWPDAFQAGTISITTVKEEPRLIAEGSVQQTALLGFRTSETRYLDVYPGVPVHIVAYPYEAEVDDRVQQRIHASIESLQEHGPRSVVLGHLQLPIPPASKGSNGVPKSKRPEISRRSEVQPEPQRRRFLDDDGIDPLCLEKIVGQNWFDEIVVIRTSQAGVSRDRRSLECYEIIDTDNHLYRFPAGRRVDVFYPATEQRERILAGELKQGMLMVVLVDDPYEDVFQRLLEAIREQSDLGAQLALELWSHAKPAALRKYAGNRANLFHALEVKGLSVDYPAVVGWYRSGEDEVLAPQRREDFEILARVSGLYPDPARIGDTFNCIEHERVARRKCGKQLSNLLSYLAAGKHYEIALKSADAIGTAVEQVASAVSLREVASVRKLAKGATA